jgi:POT family proton-dependent oligopeptide transporter
MPPRLVSDAHDGFFGHPRGLATLFMTEMWERFTYYGMRGILILFLVVAVESGGFGLDDRMATAVYGLYTTATYLMALPGGWIADRLLGAQRAVFWGAVLMLAGNLVLALPGGATLFYAGCLLVVLGVGLLKPNISAMVAQLYPEGGARRDAGFTLFYLGINVGALLGSLATPWLAQQYGWRAGFAGAAAGMALGLWQFQMTRHHLGDAGRRQRPTSAATLASDRHRWRIVWIATGSIALVFCLVAAGVVRFDPLHVARLAAGVIAAITVLFFAYLLFMAGLDRVERRRVLVVLALFVSSAVFWAGYEQAGSSMNLFAERFTDRLVGGFEIPAGWFQAPGSLYILIFAPVFSALWIQLGRRNLDPAAPVKFALGLILLGLGFLVMVVAASVVASGRLAGPQWLLIAYLLHCFGELCLSPVGLSSVTKLAPSRFVGQMMGLWFLATSFGLLLAGLIAGEFDAGDLAAMPGQYLNVALFALLSGAVLLAISSRVQRLAGGVR